MVKDWESYTKKLKYWSILNSYWNQRTVIAMDTRYNQLFTCILFYKLYIYKIKINEIKNFENIFIDVWHENY